MNFLPEPHGHGALRGVFSKSSLTTVCCLTGASDAAKVAALIPGARSVVAGNGDHMTACSLYGAVVSALYRRERTGEGAKVGTSLLGNGLWSNGFNVQAALDGANMNAKLDNDNLSAFTRVYACSDDRWFILTLLPQVQDKAWPVLATPDLRMSNPAIEVRAGGCELDFSSRARL